MSQSCPIVVAGVGGQGVISLARLLGNAATEAGLEARVGQIYGLSQRGGSVEATVRIGPGNTAFISPREATILVGLEPLEAERATPKISPEATVLLNSVPIVPTTLTLTGGTYPELTSIVSRIGEASGQVHVFDGTALATRAGDARLLNVVMLGALAGVGLLPVPSSALAAAVERLRSPSDSAAQRAFSLGEEHGSNMAGSNQLQGPPTGGASGPRPLS